MSMIKINNLTKKFGRKSILTNFNLNIENGEMVAIIGSSGTGKSTLLNIIGLIDSFDSGEMYICGKSKIKPNTNLSSKIIRENISYLFQNYALVDNETVEYNLKMALKYIKLSNQEKVLLIKNTLIDVGLEGYEKQKIFTLSGGEQQRVAIARVLVNRKNIILADEPSGSLDPKNRDIILSFIKKLNKKGSTVIIATHDQIVAEQCDRIITIQNGTALV